MLNKVEPFEIKGDTFFTTMVNGCYFRCLVSTAAAHTSEYTKMKGILRKRALGAPKELKQRLKAQGNKILHRVCLMQAEYNVTFDSKPLDSEAVRQAYDKAISMSARTGFIPDAALANELAGEYMLRLATPDEYWARHYLSAAYGLYRTWGAIRKADHLMERHRLLLTTQTQQ